MLGDCEPYDTCKIRNKKIAAEKVQEKKRSQKWMLCEKVRIGTPPELLVLDHVLCLTMGLNDLLFKPPQHTAHKKKTGSLF
jgi:hypothetical protein